MKNALALCALLTGLLLAEGCVKMGPDYQRPELPFQVPEGYGRETGEGSFAGPEDRWWHLFERPELNALVEEALRNNLDLRMATARILEVRAQFTQVRADRFPGLTFSGEAKRSRGSTSVPVISPVGTLSQKTVTSRENAYTLALPASFELDLWGRLARAEEAALADLLRAEENRNTLGQSVVAETINLFFLAEALERQIQIAEQRVENYRHGLNLMERRYERGLTSILELRQARRLLSQSESSLPALRQELGTVQQRITVLVGRYPRTRPAGTHSAQYYQEPPEVPAGLPSELLERRPDVRAAEAALAALNARVGVAKASRFPRITLTGNFGYASKEFEDFFSTTNELWNIAMGIVQPLFDAGRLEAGQRAAEARYRQGLMDYAKSVLTAFYEVENALLARKEQLERRQRILDFLKEARLTQEAAESRYNRGLVDYLNVLEATQSRYQAEDNLVQVELAILQNQVSLHRALGGGWADPGPLLPASGG